MDKTRITPPLEGFVGSLTGPQGYGLIFSGSSYQGRQITDPDFNAWNYVPGAGTAVGTAVGGPVGGAIGGTAASMFVGLFGGDTQSSNTSGTDRRQTAVFNSGLRVPTAPYPAFPAGALLAVKFNPDPIAGGIIDVEVVQAPSTSLVIDQVTDVYLVVNDAICDRTVDPVTKLAVDVGSLAVQLTTLTPSDKLIVQLQGAVTDTYKDVQKQLAKILPQGVVLPGDLGAIRSQASRRGSIVA